VSGWALMRVVYFLFCSLLNVPTLVEEEMFYYQTYGPNLLDGKKT
jgi:hypothetical protein